MMIEDKIEEAIDENNSAAFEDLLRKHPSLLYEEDGKPKFLYSVASKGLTGLLKILVDLGVDVNEKGGIGNFQTAITSASDEGHVEAVKWLIDHGATINERKNGVMWCNPLTGAAFQGFLDVVKLLIEHGADVNAIGPGMTPLDYALSYNKTDVANYLRSVGAKESYNLVPRDFPAAHKALREHVAKLFGKIAADPLSGGGPNVPPIYVAGPSAKSKHITLFTLGLSDRQIDLANGREGFVELMLHLPAKWPLDDADQAWPIEAMLSVARIAHDPGGPLSQSPVVVPNGNPPKPLAGGTKAVAWWCWFDSDSTTAYVNVPDKRAIFFYVMSPIYSEEIPVLREQGTNDFLGLWKKVKAGTVLDPNRKSVAGKRK